MAYEIIDEKKHYSLCQVIVLRNKPEAQGYVQLLRMADFLSMAEAPYLIRPRKLYKETEKWDNPESVVLKTHSRHLDKEGEVGIWEWYHVLDQNGEIVQHSSPVSSEFYERISIQRLTGRDIKNIPELIDMLFKGVEYKSPLSLPLLISVKKKNQKDFCIEIDKNSGRYENGVFQLTKGATVKLYAIPSSDFVSTVDCIKRCNPETQEKSTLTRRSIYLRYPIHESHIAELTLHPFAHYVSEYLTTLANSSVENEAVKKEIERLFRIGKKDDAVDNFRIFLSTFVNGDDPIVFTKYVEEFTKNNRSVYDRHINGKKKESNFLTYLIENTPDLKKKYYDKLVEGYLDEAKKAAEDSISDLTEEVKRLEDDKKTLSADIEKFRAEKEQLSQENEKLEQNNKELSEKSAVLQTSLSESTANLFKDLGVMRDVLSLVGAPAEEKPGQRIGRRPYQKLVTTESVGIWDQIGVAEDSLSKNLKERGFIKNDPKSLAQIIISSHLLRIPLLCFGYSAQRLVETISITLSAEMPSTLCVPTGFNDYTALLSAVNSSPSSYVILENLVGFTEEYCYTHLSEDAKDKHIIFTVPYKDTLKLLPKDLYAHFMIVDADKYSDESEPISMIKPGKIEIKGPLDKSNKTIQHRFSDEMRKKKAEMLKNHVASYNLPMSYQYSRLPLLTFMPDMMLENLLDVELETIKEITESE